MGEGRLFASPEEAMLAYYTGNIELHAKIKVRTEQGRVETSAGRLIFKDRVSADEDFLDAIFEKIGDNGTSRKILNQIISYVCQRYGTHRTAEVLDQLKRLGYRFATQSGTTIAASDISTPPRKKKILEETETQGDLIEQQYRRGLITKEERYQRFIDIWAKAKEDVTQEMVKNFDPFNSVSMMSNSGARGNVSQLSQLAGMRGLMSDPSGRIIDLPIKANFREGLTVLEFFISTHGARKGLADTALRTADSGYLTRRLVDVAQDVIVREEDCGTADGIVLSAITDGDEVIEPLHDRIAGRIAAEKLVHPQTGETLVGFNEEISEALAAQIVDAGFEEVKVRSVLTCRTRYGVCARCYGRNLATGRLSDVGEAVGIIAAQSIGEPGTQLTMRTFHTGGVAGEDITQGLPRVEELFEARKPKGQAIISEVSGTAKIVEVKGIRRVSVQTEDGEEHLYQIPYGARLKVRDGSKVEAGDRLTEGSVNPHDILKIKGIRGVQMYLVHEVQDVYRSQGVEINDKHIEVVVRQMLRKRKVETAGDTDLLPGSLVDLLELEDANQRAEESGGTPAVARATLLGITKASLATESFLSAASFQETTRVLTDAAIKGKRDELLGLKENVIIGKLIPAGTGMPKYQAVSVGREEEDPLPEAFPAREETIG
jgi:DNA-directed RNA polymerase subunit beta'